MKTYSLSVRSPFLNTNRFYFCFILLFFQIKSNATTYTVGSNGDYPTPNAIYLANVLQDGDVIEIADQEYVGVDALAVWFANNLVIKGVGGRPHLRAAGQYIYGKGIWVIKGNNVTVENIEFSEAAVPDRNGAGIRLDGDGLTVENCSFHHNENGILTANSGLGDIVITHTEFAYNGYGDGQSHNLYIGHVASLTFRENYSHHAVIGHCLKSRAKENYILYNRISDGADGSSSRLIDLPNGGLALVMGNELYQGPLAQNNNLLGYGLEGLQSTIDNYLYVTNNTFVNERTASGLFVHISNGTDSHLVANNIMAGIGTVIGGNSASGTMTTNYINPTISDVKFVDLSMYDFRLQASSPAIDYGTNAISSAVSVTPIHEYDHPLESLVRTIYNSTIDAGAHEYNNLILSSGLVRFYWSDERQKTALCWQIMDGDCHPDFFDVEASEDGKHFDKMVRIDYSDTDSKDQVYTVALSELKSIGKTYYRLKIVDIYEQVDYSPILRRVADLSSFAPYPNPARDHLIVPIHGKERSHILLYNNSGLFINSHSVLPGESRFRLDISRLTGGQYFITIRSGQGSKTYPVLIQ